MTTEIMATEIMPLAVCRPTYRIKSNSFSGTRSPPMVGQPTTYTSLRDLMPYPAFFACYNSKRPQVLGLEQLRMRNRMIELAARGHRLDIMNRYSYLAGFFGFLRIITVPFQQTHSLLQNLFHDAGTWLRRMHTSVVVV